jgi:membrane protease subunit HflK
MDYKGTGNLLYLPLDKLMQSGSATALPDGLSTARGAPAAEPAAPADSGARSRDTLRPRERGDRQ